MTELLIYMGYIPFLYTPILRFQFSNSFVHALFALACVAARLSCHSKLKLSLHFPDF